MLFYIEKACSDSCFFTAKQIKGEDVLSACLYKIIIICRKLRRLVNHFPRYLMILYQI